MDLTSNIYKNVLFIFLGLFCSKLRLIYDDYKLNELSPQRVRKSILSVTKNS